MTVQVATLAERPDLEDACWDLTRLWPRFMLEDPVADLYFSDLPSVADTAWVVTDGPTTVARAFAVPVALGPAHDRETLPAGGWDAVVRYGWLDRLAGRAATHLSALEITIAPSHRGTGLATRLIEVLRDSAQQRGLQALIAPVRPSRKADEPDTPMATYAARTRADGLPADPWLRTHVRAGGEVQGVCPASMTIGAPLAAWRAWTGLPLEGPGPAHVPGALVPVHVDVDQDHAVYVEPNVWVVHRC
ncbi:MAG: GNAT family N-acetyltransferase [Nitriliruptoraceae bacterium]